MDNIANKHDTKYNNIPNENSLIKKIPQEDVEELKENKMCMSSQL